MKWYCYLITVVIFFIYFIFSIELAFSCNVTDADAISLANVFRKKMGISFSQEPWILRTNYFRNIENSEVKEVVFGKKGDFKGTAKISCNNKEVVSFFNWELEDKVRKKYRISPITTEPRNWPPFLSEMKAKEKLLAMAKRIGLPADVELSTIGIDKENGYWGGYWVRKLNGYSYEEDKISIEILAVDGEFYSYGKLYYGKPCATEVKVGKEEAIKEGWRQIERLFTKVNWSKYKREYEIKSAELKIIQPNVLAGQITSRYSTESRLAWIIAYKTKKAPDLRNLSEINFLESITIKIDAATKKFLGGDYSQ